MIITRNCLLSILPFFCYSVNAQLEHHASTWKDQYMIRMHMTEYLSGILLSDEYLTQPDSTEEKYVSYLVEGLSYLPAKGQTLNVRAHDFEGIYIQAFDHFLRSPAEFSPAYLEKIFPKGRAYEKTTLQYDTLGRLTYVYRKTKPVSYYFEKEEISINYQNSDKTPGIKTDWKMKQLNLRAWLGGRKMRGKVISGYEYVFDAGHLQRRSSVSKRYGSYKWNGSRDFTYIIDYLRDEKGRLVGKTENMTEDSLTQRKTIIKYTEKPFSYAAVSGLYPFLKVPSIEKRIKENYPEKDLRLVDVTSSGKKETYLIYKTFVPVLKLDTQEYQPQHYYSSLEDSAGVSRSGFLVIEMPDLNDTIPFDPDYASKFPYSSRPHGIIPAISADLNRRSVTLLPEGWKMITYHRNSDGQTAFAPDYPAMIRLDHVQNAYVFVDDKDVVRYYFEYNKLYKVSW